MKYTARNEGQVANIARGEAECYICHETFIKSCIFYTKRQCFKCFIKTHGSESRGQEEAGLRDEPVSYLQVAPL